jgi:hypothetical protein
MRARTLRKLVEFVDGAPRGGSPWALPLDEREDAHFGMPGEYS